MDEIPNNNILLFYQIKQLDSMLRIDEIPNNNILLFLSYKTVRFHVVVTLRCGKSRGTSKCGWNITNTLDCAIACAPFSVFLPHFDIICGLLLSRSTASWNLFVK